MKTTFSIYSIDISEREQLIFTTFVKMDILSYTTVLRNFNSDDLLPDLRALNHEISEVRFKILKIYVYLTKNL